ncbi:unnamed protein product [marine sediment metagenome]|uniref:Core-binding (CB) domain-containing protein n=1 Tax=marine sediment metagenome TaxID=412755 RepID=X1K8F3_9ZZZZ
MQEVFTKYINYLEAERNVSPYTVRNYTTDLLDFFNFLKDKGVSSLREVDRHVVRDYLSYLMEQGFVKGSIARKLSAIRSFYRYLLREEIVATSPVTTTSPKLDRRLPSSQPHHQVDGWQRYVSAYGDKPFYLYQLG